MTTSTPPLPQPFAPPAATPAATPAPTPDDTMPAPPAPAAPGADEALDRSLVRGIAWTGGLKWAGQAVSWVTTVLVARMLSPEDYGLVGMANVYMNLVTMLSEFGLSAAVVTLRSLTEEQLRQINAVSVLLGIGAFALSCVVAWPLGDFFRAPQLPPVVIALSTVFLISGVKIVPNALLQRDLAFRRLAIYDGVQTLVLSACMVAAAAAGFRHWTLVLGSVLSAIVSTALVLSQRPVGFSRPSLDALRDSLRFGRDLLLQRIAWFAYSDADFVVAGRILGQKALGAYTFAWTLANVPIEKITSMVVAVTPAVFARVQDDHASLRRYLLTISEGIAIITFPATIGMALVARPLVEALLGPQWMVMVWPLRLLAAYAAVRSLTPLVMQVGNITGDSRYGARLNLVAAVALPIAFVIGSRWGVSGIALAWLLVHPPFLVLPLAVRVFGRIGLGAGAFGRAILPATIATSVMALAVLGIDAATATLPATLRLLLQIAGGGLAYGVTLLLGFRRRLSEYRSLWQHLRG